MLSYLIIYLSVSVEKKTHHPGRSTPGLILMQACPIQGHHGALEIPVDDHSAVKLKGANIALRSDKHVSV